MTPEDLAAIRARHTPRVKVAVEECRFCATDWPCDAARALAEVDRLRVAARSAARLWLMGIRTGRAAARGEIRARVEWLRVSPRDKPGDNDWQRGFRQSRNETVAALLAAIEGADLAAIDGMPPTTITDLPDIGTGYPEGRP